MNLTTTTVCMFLLVLCAVHAQEKGVEQFQWLEGKWQGSEGEGILVETWALQNTTTLLGTGFYMIGGDTVMREALRIQKFGPHWGFVAVINNQHPVLFTLVESTDTMLVFENTEHDFPQRIVYTKRGTNEIFAWIEGQLKGESARDEYRLQRVR